MKFDDSLALQSYKSGFEERKDYRLSVSLLTWDTGPGDMHICLGDARRDFHRASALCWEFEKLRPAGRIIAIA